MPTDGGASREDPLSLGRIAQRRPRHHGAGSPHRRRQPQPGRLRLGAHRLHLRLPLRHLRPGLSLQRLAVQAADADVLAPRLPGALLAGPLATPRPAQAPRRGPLVEARRAGVHLAPRKGALARPHAHRLGMRPRRGGHLSPGLRLAALRAGRDRPGSHVRGRVLRSSRRRDPDGGIASVVRLPRPRRQRLHGHPRRHAGDVAPHARGRRHRRAAIRARLPAAHPPLRRQRHRSHALGELRVAARLLLRGARADPRLHRDRHAHLPAVRKALPRLPAPGLAGHRVLQGGRGERRARGLSAHRRGLRAQAPDRRPRRRPSRRRLRLLGPSGRGPSWNQLSPRGRRMGIARAHGAQSKKRSPSWRG